jgi:hypothetical protein
MMQAMGDMTGLEAVRAALRGELPAPPVSELLGTRGVEAEKGRVIVAFADDVRARRFPADEHCYGIEASELEQLMVGLGRERSRRASRQ